MKIKFFTFISTPQLLWVSKTRRMRLRFWRRHSRVTASTPHLWLRQGSFLFWKPSGVNSPSQGKGESTHSCDMSQGSWRAWWTILSIPLKCRYRIRLWAQSSGWKLQEVRKIQEQVLTLTFYLPDTPKEIALGPKEKGWSAFSFCDLRATLQY